MIFPEDYPRPRRAAAPRRSPSTSWPRSSSPANLDRWDNPAYRLITAHPDPLRAADLRRARLPFDCIVTDADGAPYLRYYNHKMKREALVPIDDELRALISGQQQRVLRALARRDPGAVPPAAGEPGRDRPGQQRHLPRGALPLAGTTATSATSTASPCT